MNKKLRLLVIAIAAAIAMWLTWTYDAGADSCSTVKLKSGRVNTVGRSVDTVRRVSYDGSWPEYCSCLDPNRCYWADDFEGSSSQQQTAPASPSRQEDVVRVFGMTLFTITNYANDTGTTQHAQAPQTAPCPSTKGILLKNTTVQITADVLNVRVGPGQGCQQVTSVRNGETYTASEEAGGWYHIATGWISGQYVTVANTTPTTQRAQVVPVAAAAEAVPVSRFPLPVQQAQGRTNAEAPADVPASVPVAPRPPASYSTAPNSPPEKTEKELAPSSPNPVAEQRQQVLWEALEMAAPYAGWTMVLCIIAGLVLGVYLLLGRRVHYGRRQKLLARADSLLAKGSNAVHATVARALLLREGEKSHGS